MWLPTWSQASVGAGGLDVWGEHTLKLLSRESTTHPRRDQNPGAHRLAIELGAGFHPDLTGRENIYLNGAIMGLSCQRGPAAI